MNKEHEKKIREIENNLLDNEFHKYELVKYANQVAVPHLLKVYGDLMRELYSERFAERSEFVLWKGLSEFSDGLTHCLKWVINNPGNKNSNELSYEEKDEKALEFLTWGKQYHSVAQQYVAWSRKMIDVKLNENQKEIEFSPLNLKEYYFALSQDISSKVQMDAYIESFPNELLKEYYSKWIEEVDISKPPINVDWGRVKSSDILNDIKAFFSNHMIPEIDGNIDLGGYTLDDFIHFYSCLYITFDFVISIEDYVDAKTNFKNLFGSNPLVLPKNKLIEFFIYMTGLTAESTINIIEDIKLDTKKFHSKIVTQPLVEAENYFYILPRIFNRVYPNHLLPNILTKGAKNNLYSKLINSIESNNLDKIELQINKNQKFDFKVKKEPMLSSGNKKITPDFLLIDEINRELLIIDYKHFLSPFSAADTYNRLNEVKKGVKQVRSYLDFFNKLRNDIMDEIQNYNSFGMLLFHNPMVLPFKMPEEKNITLTNLDSFFKYLDKSSSLLELNTLISQFPELGVKVESCSYEESNIIVEGWKFKWKIVVAD